MKAADYGSVQGFYAYDGLGRRIESREGTSTSLYGYQGTETLSDLFGGTISNDYVYSGGLRIARTGEHVSTNYYVTDALGSTRLVTDKNGNIVFSDNYQAFGQDNSSTGSETYKFTGKPVSQTTGLYYEYKRWYDPAVGRFVSRDPVPTRLSNPQDLNGYSYAGNTPTTLIDPSGLAAVYAGNPGKWPCWDWFGLLPCHQGGAPGLVSTVTTTLPSSGPVGPLLALGVLGIYGIYLGGTALYDYFNSHPSTSSTGSNTDSSGQGGRTTPSPTDVSKTSVPGPGTISPTDAGVGQPSPWPPKPPKEPPPLVYVPPQNTGSPRANAICVGIAFGAGVLIGGIVIGPQLARGEDPGVGRDIQAAAFGGISFAMFYALCRGMASKI